jgi:CRISPR system Cascade subunit CasC
MFVELHMIQNFAPSNLNRDDSNNPKDCEFGGYRRARISSQCIKRAIRTHPVFAATTATGIGQRTKWLTRLISRSLQSAGRSEEDARAVASAFAEAYGGKLDSSKERTSVLLYLSPGEVKTMTAGLLENWEGVLAEARGESRGDQIKKVVNDIVRRTGDRTGAPDIALFGRMLAHKPELNLDAACQVAHALSTHRVNMEMDYYTAVDDLLEGEEAGAGMVGFTSFNSACFYRYARIDWDQLATNLYGDVGLARRTVEGFLRAAVAAVPTGKQNAFAAQNPPSFLLAVVREDGMSWSLANAFEAPVRAEGNDGLVAPSIAAMDAYWGQLQQVYGQNGVTTAALALETGAPLENLAAARQPDLGAWVECVLAALPQEEAA